MLRSLFIRKQNFYNDRSSALAFLINSRFQKPRYSGAGRALLMALDATQENAGSGVAEMNSPRNPIGSQSAGVL
jgi:hypothetical protein